MKIAMAARTLTGQTGASAIVFEHARFLAGKGATVNIFGEKINPDLVRATGAEPVFVPSFGLTDLQRRKSFASRTQARIAQGKYDLTIGNGDLLTQDVVFLHNLVHRASEVTPGENERKVKSVGRIHDGFLKTGSFRLLIANSRLMKDDLLIRYKIPEHKVYVVHPGNDLSRFSKERKNKERFHIREELGIETDEILIGLITSGNFPKRGVKPFFQALNLLPNEVQKQIRVLLVGKDKSPSTYTGILNATLRDRFIHIPQTQTVERLFYALDVFMLPAYIEEFGLVVQEAMACGLPIITTKMVGSSEVLPGIQREFVLDNNVPQLLASAMQKLISQRDRWPVMGNCNAETVLQNNWDFYNKQIIGLYHRILGLHFC